MKKCTYCGATMHEDDQYCLQCGKKVKTYPNDISTNRFVYGFFSFFIPLLGFILYFLLKDTRSIQAKTSLRWAFIGLIMYVILGLLLFLFYFYILVEIFT